ncbi:glycoside hydrolase family 13 protein [Priestia filamentosa]|uniref:glycoside hydrolase family 13 protein n=1 Tax=Priestia filamentosa TaxID=1402861 RepID=UPI000589589D|nr:alpha-glucosidase [Priestia filamentosa]MDT3763288.1 alpha-glucosidase [Priestia filamentosa]OXS69792.1 alpha-glucosidase [Priestia filamentosa]WRU93754.1 alpha-glucosidase [Priestia filamentosa]SMF36310.1 alpha-glucosidase [Priestia filamentosa]
MKKQWWKEAIAYQIYPRSFMDSNGDGIGDIKGILSKLDYLKELGIDVIWISPIYKSPNDDNGYDISDYKAIAEEYGTLDDFDELLEAVHKRGMKLIMDLVINHTSDEHPWFIESRSSKDNKYRDYYIWRDGKEAREPNNWESIFGGSAWEYNEETDDYYLHVFSKKQPDLNWENPAVRENLYEMVNWWLDKGIDGFRVDAISHIKKIEGLPDLPNPDGKRYVSSFAGHMNKEGIQPFLEELKRETFSKYDIMTVGEANGVSVEDGSLWVGEEEGKFNMVFQFEHLDLWGKGIDGKIDIRTLKEVLTKWQKGLHNIGWNALFLENHDQPRSVSTWGDDGDYWLESSKALATMYFLMQGTPFIYQGQEIGMTNVQFSSIKDYNDVAIKNLYKEEREKGKSHEEIMPIIWKNGRDNSRTPMQWDRTENAGFSEGTPWIKVNENYKNINVEKALDDPHSLYHYYKKLISLRKEKEVLVYGDYHLILEEDDKIYAYTRTLGEEKVLVMVNLFKERAHFHLPLEYKGSAYQLLLSNYDIKEEQNANHIVLQPYEARVYRLD